MANNKSRYLPHIDGLRAIAVLLVLLFHLEIPGFSGGFVGVDVFLVISGFLITRLIFTEISQTGKFRFGHFYLRRIRRLAPALFATTTATLLVSALLHSPAMLARTGKELVATVLSISNIHFWLESDYFDVSAATRPMLHTWSLSLEEQFYLIWPVMLLVLWRTGLRTLLFWAILALAAASLLLNVSFAEGAPESLSQWLPEVASDGKTTLFYMLPFRVFEFAVGGLLALRIGEIAQPSKIAGVGFVAGLALIVASSTLYDESMLFPSWAALVPCIGAALVIYGGAASRLLTHAMSIWIGNISYSLYLVHWPCVVFWAYLFGPMNGIGQAFVFVLSLLLGHVSWRFIETPFRERRLPLWPVAVGLPALLVCGWHATASGGWPERIDSPFDPQGTTTAGDFHREHYGGRGFANGRVGDDERLDFILIGDSHAKQFAEGLVRDLVEPHRLGAHINAGTSCLHIPGFLRVTKGRDWAALLERELAELRLVLENSSPQPVVLLGQSWLEQASRSVAIGPEGEHLPGPITPEQIVEGLVRLSDAYGIEKLVVMGQVPNPPVADLFEQLQRPALSRRIDATAARTFPLTPDVRRYNAALRDGAVRTGAYEFLDTVIALSQDGRCIAINDGGELVYSDATHLSKAGSRMVIRHVADRLRHLVDQR